MIKEIRDQELNKFFDGPNGVTVRTGGSGSILAGISWDSLSVAYPSNATEVYTYALNGVNICAVTVVYSGSSKHEMLSVTRVML